MNKSKKQQQFKADSIALAPKTNLITNKAHEGRERDHRGYIEVKAGRMQHDKKIRYYVPDPNNPEAKPKVVKIVGSRIKPKIKDVNKPHVYRNNDQNLGYISKKRYYGRFTTNPKTKGRGLAIIEQPKQAADQESEYMQIEGITIEAEYTEE
jgi:hypothetical protein